MSKWPLLHVTQRLKGITWTNTGGNITTAIPAQPHMEQGCHRSSVLPTEQYLEKPSSNTCEDGSEQREQRVGFGICWQTDLWSGGQEPKTPGKVREICSGPLGGVSTTRNARQESSFHTHDFHTRTHHSQTSSAEDKSPTEEKQNVGCKFTRRTSPLPQTQPGHLCARKEPGSCSSWGVLVLVVKPPCRRKHPSHLF